MTGSISVNPSLDNKNSIPEEAAYPRRWSSFRACLGHKWATTGRCRTAWPNPGYAVCMSVASTSNMRYSHDWHVSALGCGWKADKGSGLSSLSAEFGSGPLISDVHSVAQPNNGGVQFANVCRAAGGKARHSVRWRTSRRTQVRQALLTRLWFWKEHLACALFKGPQRAAVRLSTAEKIFADFSEDPRVLSEASSWMFFAFSRRRRGLLQHKQRLLRARFEDQNLNNNSSIFNSCSDIFFEDAFAVDECVERSASALRSGKMPAAEDLWMLARVHGDAPLLTLLRFFFGWDGISRAIMRALFRYLEQLIARVSLRETQQLKALEATAFLAHLSQYIRPATRDRDSLILRPYHARPRPPSAPLAPPVFKRSPTAHA